MSAIPGYAFGRRLVDGERSILFRARQEAGAGSAIVRVLRDDMPEAADLVALRHEYEMSRGFEADGVLRPLSLVRSSGGLAIVYEDFDGDPLQQLVSESRLDVETALEIAVSAAETLAVIHRAEIVHRNVQPASFLVSPQTRAVRITDFSCATSVPRERREFGGEGTAGIPLAYISPEQTGRTNRSVDFRTDLYSFGAVLYQMLAGESPFVGDDPVQVVHQHLAREPRPLHDLVPGVPQRLSDLVAKLLAKRPEDRYQSALGLKADLEEALAQWRAGGDVRIELGRHDMPDTLQVPERLYGREREVEELLAAFERVAGGATEYVLVGGYSGVGKSALLHEVHEPISRRHGHFVWGKFDQFRRESPYSALVQAFTTLVRQVLALPAREVETFRARVLAALGDMAGVMLEMVPELELVLGPQPPVPELSPTEAQIRFNLCFQRFVAAIASAERPIAIFVDDLQWADSATLNLMQHVTVTPETRHVLFLGAYRDNEVSVHHPLILAIAQLKRSPARFTEITLQPLAVEHLQALLADALRTTRERCAPLAALVHEKTGGNPFYMGQFLRFLAQERLLYADAKRGEWVWDVARIQAAETTENVVDLMLSKIRRLPRDAQDVLQLAACVGSRFDLETLAIVHEVGAADVGRRLWPAVREGLVLPMGEAYRAVPQEDHPWDADGTLTGAVTFRFLHDRVQQAAAALLGEDEQRGVHLRIGRLLLARLSDELRQERIFEVVDHLDAAVAVIASAEERLQLAALNLEAGRKAAASSAFAPAARYLEQGIELLPKDAWERHYELTLGLHVAAAEAHHMVLAVEAGERRGDAVLANARTTLDRVPIYEMRIQSCVTRGLMRDAVMAALEPLAMLGVRFPEKPNMAHALLRFGRIWLRIKKRPLEELLHAPRMEDHEKLAAMRLLTRVISAAYQGARELFPLLVLAQIDLTLEHGNSPHSSYAYGAFATTVWAVLGDLERTYAFGKLGYDLAMRFPDKDLQARETFMFNTFQRHWKEPQRVCYEPIVEARRLSVEGGDLEYYAYCLYHAVYISFLAGEELAETHHRFEEITRKLENLEMEQAIPMARIGLQMTTNLRGEVPSPTLLKGDHYDTAAEKPRMLEMSHFAAVYYAHLAGTIVAYVFGDYRRAVAEAHEAEQHIGNVLAMTVIPGLKLFQALACAAAAREASGAERRKLLRTVSRNRKKLASWATAAACNFAHKAQLVEAELAAVQGRDDAAERLYDRAIAGARAEQFPQEEAIAAECAALHYVRRGRPTIAAAYMREAVSAYMAWGADAKVRALRRSHPELLRIEVSAAPATAERSARTGAELGTIDLHSVLDAAQVISGEIVLDRLLGRLLAIVVRNAGAERGALVRMVEHEPRVAAVGNAEDSRLLGLQPLEECDQVPSTIVGYVVRTRQPLVLADASAEPRHANDEYVARVRPKSVLAVPVLNQGEVSAVLYVENNLTTGAFTEERLEVLRMLASQASISLENARLYTDLSQLNKAYERFVPRQFLRFLAKKSITDVELGDQVQRDVSVLIADIRSFTALAESMKPEDTFRFLNAYLGRMEPIVLRHGGFIDKYMGDAIMALFGGQGDAPLRAAVEMTRALGKYNVVRAERGDVPVRVGIGINAGPAMLGTIGGHERMDGTVIGDTVNMAGRVEGLTKQFGVGILLTQRVVDHLAEPERYRLRSLGRVRVHGKSDWVTLYELYSGDPEEVIAAKDATRGVVDTGLEHFHAGRMDEADRCFGEALARLPEDSAVAFLRARVRAMAGVPLPDDWDGAVAFATK